MNHKPWAELARQAAAQTHHPPHSHILRLTLLYQCSTRAVHLLPGSLPGHCEPNALSLKRLLMRTTLQYMFLSANSIVREKSGSKNQHSFKTYTRALLTGCQLALALTEQLEALKLRKSSPQTRTTTEYSRWAHAPTRPPS